MLTLAFAYAHRGDDEAAFARRAARTVEPAPETGRCAIFQARFGGARAELVRVMRGSLANYVVIEVGKRDPLLRRQRSIWLRATYGDGELTWIGSYSSPDAAMTRAVALCPPHLRCWPGDSACGSKDEMPSPARTFLNL